MQAGVIAVLLARAHKQRIPNALAIKARLDRGDKISDYDLSYLLNILNHSHDSQLLLDHHPELHEVALKMTSLYIEISRKALDNENR
jgi:hypothetical protein